MFLITPNYPVGATGGGFSFFYKCNYLQKSASDACLLHVQLTAGGFFKLTPVLGMYLTASNLTSSRGKFLSLLLFAGVQKFLLAISHFDLCVFPPLRIVLGKHIYTCIVYISYFS